MTMALHIESIEFYQLPHLLKHVQSMMFATTIRPQKIVIRLAWEWERVAMSKSVK